MSAKFTLILFLNVLLPLNVQMELFTFDDKYRDSEESIAQNSPKAVGTVLFDQKADKMCFSQTDLALLLARKEFEKIIPILDNDNQEIENDAAIAAIIEYLSGASQLIDGVVFGETKRLVQKSFYDAVGGYLNHFLFPYTKMIFYAGNVTYQTVSSVQELLDYCKELLNTKGNGWASPRTDFFNLTVRKLPELTIEPPTSSSKPPCVDLVLLEGEDDDILVRTPRIDNDDSTTIWMPFKRKHAFRMESQVSSFLLMRYFIKVRECYSFQGVDQTKFNRNFLDWLTENVLFYLNDDGFFPAFGGVLRIFETIEAGSASRAFLNRQDRPQSDSPMVFSQDLGDDGPQDLLSATGNNETATNENSLNERILRIAVLCGTVLLVFAFFFCFVKMYKLRKTIKRKNMTGIEKRKPKLPEDGKNPKRTLGRQCSKIQNELASSKVISNGKAQRNYSTSEASSYTTLPTANGQLKKSSQSTNQNYLKRMTKYQDKTNTIASLIRINEKHPANNSRYKDLQLFAVDSGDENEVLSSSSCVTKKTEGTDREGKHGRQMENITNIALEVNPDPKPEIPTIESKSPDIPVKRQSDSSLTKRIKRRSYNKYPKPPRAFNKRKTKPTTINEDQDLASTSGWETINK